MERFVKMNIKIQYVLDNEANSTYQARSKTPLEIRIGELPCESTGQHPTKIGAAQLPHILNEIYDSSPELIESDVERKGFDYNIYYKDVCESDQPFVSMGLLSQLQKKIVNNLKQNNSSLEDSSIYVLGKICTNFSPFGNSKSKTPTGTTDILEIKLKFSKLLISSKPQHLKEGKIVLRDISNKIAKPTNSIIANTKRIGPVKQAQGKRQTNPMPAPKAKRTQSLPISNQKIASNSCGLPINSIAHKIFLADRKVYDAQPVHQNIAYHITTVQENNYLQKMKIDDSVSKRFDFMFGKKKKPNKTIRQLNHCISQKENISNTTQTFTQQSVNESRILQLPENYGTENHILHNFINSANVDILGANLNHHDFMNKIKKENNSGALIDDMQFAEDNILRHLEILTFPEADTKDNDDWFDDITAFNVPLINEGLSNMGNGELISKTPQEVNAENIISISLYKDEASHIHEKYQEKDLMTSDIDKTSPIDTLSMPLMELNQKASSHIDKSCQEQLKRIPILTPKLREQNDEQGLEDDKEFNDATSLLMNWSTPPQELVNHDYGYDDAMTLKLKLKKQQALPSSPTTMFNYEGNTYTND